MKSSRTSSVRWLVRRGPRGPAYRHTEERYSYVSAPRKQRPSYTYRPPKTPLEPEPKPTLKLQSTSSLSVWRQVQLPLYRNPPPQHRASAGIDRAPTPTSSTPPRPQQHPKRGANAKGKTCGNQICHQYETGLYGGVKAYSSCLFKGRVVPRGSGPVGSNLGGRVESRGSGRTSGVGSGRITYNPTPTRA